MNKEESTFGFHHLTYRGCAYVDHMQHNMEHGSFSARCSDF